MTHDFFTVSVRRVQSLTWHHNWNTHPTLPSLPPSLPPSKKATLWPERTIKNHKLSNNNKNKNVWCTQPHPVNKKAVMVFFFFFASLSLIIYGTVLLGGFSVLWVKILPGILMWECEYLNYGSVFNYFIYVIPTCWERRKNEH